MDKNSYLNTDFILTFPTVDHFTAELKKVGRGAHFCKIDVSRVFHHIKLDPHDYDLLGLKWDDAFYMDTCLPIGSRRGTQIFQHMSDAVHYVMRRNGFTVVNYVDDFVGIGILGVTQASYHFLLALLKRLGLDVSEKKVIHPGTKVVCFGVEIDTVNCTIAIPQDNLLNIVKSVNEWLHKTSCTKRQLQSLLGYLLYVHKCVKPSEFS